MKHFSILISSLGTAILIAVILILGFIGMQHYFERKPDLEQLMQQLFGGPSDQKEQTYWEKFTEVLITGQAQAPELAKERPQSQVQRPGSEDGSGQGEGDKGVQGTTTSKDQLAFRQYLTAYGFQVAHNISEEKALDIPPQFQGQQWTEYELARARSRVMGTRFDRTRDYSYLPSFYESSKYCYESTFRNFEDLLWFGFAAIHANQLDEARVAFTESAETWPVRDHFYGLIFYFQACIAAIDDNWVAVNANYQKFKKYYSEWLYTETYMVELDGLETVYGHKPLFNQIRLYVYFDTIQYFQTEKVLKTLQSDAKDARFKDHLLGVEQHLEGIRK